MKKNYHRRDFIKSTAIAGMGLSMVGVSSTFARGSNPWAITIDPDVPYLVERIWDKSKSGLPYNAFTDLIRFRGAWYCTFREAEIHNSHDSGRARVLKSSDGKRWNSVALFEWDGGCVRDPKLSVTAEGKLMLYGSISFVSRNQYQRQSVTWLSSDGETWSNVYACNSGINTWRWSVTWHNGIGYSIGYSGKDATGTLYTTCDGMTWEMLVENIFPGGHGNETSIVFGGDDRAYCLSRAGGIIPTAGVHRPAYLGIAEPPYTEWIWTDLGLRGPIGGPKMIRLKDGRFLAGGRYGGTTLLWIDPERSIAERFLTLPSGGQSGTSYPGIVEHDGMIWISYYSGHEYERIEDRTYDSAPCAIYLAKVKLAPPGNSS